MYSRTLIAMTIAVVWSSPSAQAQHDDCAQAIPIQGEGSFPFTTLGATDSGLPPSCMSYYQIPSLDTWFQWTPDISGSYLFTACGQADYAMVMSVRTGCAGGGYLACEWQGCYNAGYNNNEALVGPVTAGTPYWIQFDGYAGQTGSGVLDIIHISSGGLGAENCVGAEPISGLGTWIWNAALAHPSPSNEPNCIDNYGGLNTFGGDDVWFAWTAPYAGFFQIDGCTQSSQHPIIVVYEGHDCPPPPHLGCSGALCDGGVVRTQAAAGEPFLLRLGHADRGLVNISEAVPLPNDECANAIPMGTGTGTFPFVTEGASDSQVRPSCASTGINDVWYEWTSGAAGTYRFSLSGWARGLALLDGCGGAEIACTETFLEVDLPAGTTYMLQLFATTSEGAGDLIIETFVAPPNDDCADAIPIAGLGPQPFDTTDSSTDGPGTGECGGPITNDVWFEWTAPTSDYYKITISGAPFVLRMQLFEGVTCPPGAPLACGLGSRTIHFSTTAGQNYLLRIGSGSGPSQGSGTIALSTFVPTANDEIAGVIALPQEEGVFPYSTANATLSADPLSDSCLNLTYVDVWFTWRPPENFAFWRFQSSGNVNSSRIAIYNASTFAQLECGNTIVNGGMNFFTNYLIRVGTTSATPGSLLIERYHPAGGFNNDECVNARSIQGLGTFEFNNLQGTTDDPQNDPTCGSIPPIRALWYDWTAPESSTFRAETCGLTGVDTVLAVYEGSSCPVTQSLACNNNACGVQSRIEWPANEGQHYLLRIGNRHMTPQGYGLIRITDLEAGGLGTVYCAAVPTSSGEPGQISAAGSTSMSANALELTATGLPPSVFGLFFFGANQLNVPLGDGTACVGGQVFRLPVQQADASGTLHQPNFWALSNSSFVMPGSTWHFQSWFRDAPTGMSGFNLSNALTLFFTL